jgi:formylglycine-generating enzyme required for sulfatase activity
MLIRYCEGCGQRIPDADLQSGRAVQAEANTCLCAGCAAKRVQPPRPAPFVSADVPALNTASDVPPHASHDVHTASAPVRGRKPALGRAQASAQTSNILLLAGGVAGLLGIALVLWSATTGSGGHDEERVAAKTAAAAVRPPLAAPSPQGPAPRTNERTAPVAAQTPPASNPNTSVAPTVREDKPVDAARPGGGLLSALVQDRPTGTDAEKPPADRVTRPPDEAKKPAPEPPEAPAAASVEAPKPTPPPEQKVAAETPKPTPPPEQKVAVETPKPTPPPEQKVQVEAPIKVTHAGGFPDTVLVGNPGNAADSTNFGAVAYSYQIGRYEVTNAQYCEFLNAAARTDTYGLYNPGMAGEYGGIIRNGAPGSHTYTIKDGMGNKPVNFVSWYDALRYANWLTNGKRNGGTEMGSYTLAPAGAGWRVTMPDHAALAAGKVAKWVLASENEWYKAAYYDPGKPGGPGYWPYAAKGGGTPACNSGSGAPSDAGAFKDSASAYGTFDQNGNMWEWNETQGNGMCGVRGGSFYLNDKASYMHSSTRYVSNPPTFEFCNYGFRVALLGSVPGKNTALAGPARAAGSAAPAGPTKTEDAVKSPTAPKRVTPATFYVSQSAGNDSWTGEAANPEGTRGPWKTLARASTDYIAGDKILLKCGETWNEEFHPKGNGTAERPITIGSYGKGAKPIIDRQDDRKDLFGIRLSDQEGFKIVGIEFAKCMTGIYGEYAVGSPTRKFIWIEDCYFHDSLLYQHYEDYPKRKIGLGICFFSHEVRNNIVLKDITVRNCVFRRLASGIWTNSPDNFNKNAGNIYNFGNFVVENCLFEEGYQWQLGMRGVDGGAVRSCVTHDIGRGFRAFNGVAGAMFARCKNWVFEDSEWGFIDIGQGSGDGEAFDFESNCDHMTMRNCLFHDTDGPGFLLCCYASGPEPEKDIRMENCVLNGKAKRPIRLPRCEILNTTDWNEVTWKNCRFYLSKGEVLMKVMDPEKDKKSSFVNCVLKDLSAACSTPRLAAKLSASSEAAGNEAAKAGDGDPATAWKATAAENQWVQLDFGAPTTVNEFRLKEDPASSVIRYVIECWDDKESRWAGCFNGRTIGSDFVAPIVSRTTQKARLMIVRTEKGNPAISAFDAYNDTTGEVFNVPVGGVPPGRAGR